MDGSGVDKWRRCACGLQQTGPSPLCAGLSFRPSAACAWPARWARLSWCASGPLEGSPAPVRQHRHHYRRQRQPTRCGHLVAEKRLRKMAPSELGVSVLTPRANSRQLASLLAPAALVAVSSRSNLLARDGRGGTRRSLSRRAETRCRLTSQHPRQISAITRPAASGHFLFQL